MVNQKVWSNRDKKKLVDFFDMMFKDGWTLGVIKQDDNK